MGRPPRQSSSDASLLRRVARGDEPAFAELVRRHEARFFRVAHRILGDPRDAEDAVQLAYLRVFRKASDYRAEWAASPWIYRVLTNVCIDVWRKRRRQSAGCDDREIEAIAGQAPSRSARIDLRRALARLSPEMRAVVVLRFSEDLSYDDIARARGVSVNTIKTQLARAKKVLRAQLQGGER